MPGWHADAEIEDVGAGMHREKIKLHAISRSVPIYFALALFSFLIRSSLSLKFPQADMNHELVISQRQSS